MATGTANMDRTAMYPLAPPCPTEAYKKPTNKSDKAINKSTFIYKCTDEYFSTVIKSSFPASQVGQMYVAVKSLNLVPGKIPL